MRSQFRQGLGALKLFLLELSFLLFPGVSTEKFPLPGAKIAPGSLTGVQSQVDRNFEEYDGSTGNVAVFV